MNGWKRNRQGDKGNFFFKDAPSDEEGLTAQMTSIFVDKIFLYDRKKVEVVLNFKDEYESFYTYMGQNRGAEEGSSQNE